ncbi:hypothetical protein M426DRAFT_147909 [Hypoxylon sp. CI-4A]|nr:hypothetical protein M426DRAFT_147909 [Hypoxylon sp. CI-4A]
MLPWWRTFNLVSITALACSVFVTVLLYTGFIHAEPSITMWSWVSLLIVPVMVTAAADVDLAWYPPSNTSINNLTAVLDNNGIYGFIFNTSDTPDTSYGTYNWCNMPHIRKSEYVKPPVGYELTYVEVIQRHHKRTPYSSNAFPVESYRWDCDDQGLYYYGRAFGDDSKQPAQGFWKGYISSVNPFVPSGWIGTCQFPQITSAGLDDAWVHGQDLYEVYHDLFGFLPGRDDDWQSKVSYRVTNNVITSQVAGMVINGMWRTTESVPLLIQAAGVDSLEPQYTCDVGSDLFDAIKSSSDAPWQDHLDAATDLFNSLDDISGVPSNDSGFHASFDHYFDNLSARQCHAKPLPCKLEDGVNSTTCVDQDIADTVYRMGQWEYSRMYRDAPNSLAASIANYGVWIAELAEHIRNAMSGGEGPIYLHNVAHDGSISRILSILQADVMVWPGMGSEVVFEIYESSGNATTSQNQGTSSNVRKKQTRSTKSSSSTSFFVRILFGGRPLKSSNPSLGKLDMIPVDTLLAYFDGLVGSKANLVMGKCNGTIPV